MPPEECLGRGIPSSYSHEVFFFVFVFAGRGRVSIGTMMNSSLQFSKEEKKESETVREKIIQQF